MEIDNEFEHRLPHRTTRHDEPDGSPDGPWLVSFALWANVLQYVGDEGITVADLRARARTDQLLLGGLRRWGYVSVTPPDGQPRRNPPQNEATVRARKAARGAQRVWRHLPSVIDGRWRTRLGRPAVDRLERALMAVFEELPVDPPAYLPVIHPTQGGRLEAPHPRREPGSPLPPEAALSTQGSLSPLLSGVLLAFTVDYESRCSVSLPISANSLRVLNRSGTRIGDLPRLTGVSREANAMCTGWLERQGCAVVEPVASARRGKAVRLTPKGERAQQNHRRLLAATEEAWRSTYGADAVAALRAALQDVVGDGTFTSSPLASGLVPYPDNWRAKVRRPQTLPHHPMVLHRGGYPDGS